MEQGCAEPKKQVERRGVLLTLCIYIHKWWWSTPTHAGVGSRATSLRTTTTHPAHQSGTNLVPVIRKVFNG